MATESIQSGIYFIQNWRTGTVLDLTGANPANGTKIQGFAKRELSDLRCPAQFWVISQVSGSGNMYTVENVNSRSFMDMENASCANGTRVIGHSRNGGRSLQWLIIRHSNKMAYTIQNVQTLTFADLDKGSTANGTQVIGWTGEGSVTTNPNQMWLIVRA